TPTRLRGQILKRGQLPPGLPRVVGAIEPGRLGPGIDDIVDRADGNGEGVAGFERVWGIGRMLPGLALIIAEEQAVAIRAAPDASSPSRIGHEGTDACAGQDRGGVGGICRIDDENFIAHSEVKHGHDGSPCASMWRLDSVAVIPPPAARSGSAGSWMAGSPAPSDRGRWGRLQKECRLFLTSHVLTENRPEQRG